MGRAPCCEKMGLKQGPWTADEDLILINYVSKNGHENWRALPKRAGLLRCGKSCRLRWMNYLRPDIKRGNFTKEEEETIIKLHQELGNRWSLIAASLPGRTDNEIKNVWHTHLKKRLHKKSQSEPIPVPVTNTDMTGSSESVPITNTNNGRTGSSEPIPVINTDTTGSSDSMGQNPDPHSPTSESSSDVSLITNSVLAGGSDDCMMTETTTVAEMDENFWLEVFSGDDSSATSNFWASNDDFGLPQFGYGFDSDVCSEGGIDFWYDMLNRADGLIQVPEF